jgi:hypothetical protein
MKVLECSSRGDRRFSAFYAKLPDGRSIEEHYQCDVKGHDPGGRNWRKGKGKPPVDRSVDTQSAYDNLWRQWLALNPELRTELARLKQDGYVFSDMFAHGRLPNQADTLYRLCDEKPND